MTKPPLKLVGFFHGIDPATQADFYVDFVHALFEKPKIYHGEKAEDKLWIPVPVYIFRTHYVDDPNVLIDKQVKIFNKFPSMFTVIDGSREIFLANSLMRKYGESRFEILKFLNAGQSNVKFELKQIGYRYIKAGYEFPDLEVVEKTMPKQAELYRIFKKEALRELMHYTKNNRLTFDHPLTKHNDLVHGWEMSLKAVMKFQQKNLGYEKRAPSAPAYNTVLEEIYRKKAEEEEKNAEDPIYQKLRGNTFDYDGRPIP